MKFLKFQRKIQKRLMKYIAIFRRKFYTFCFKLLNQKLYCLHIEIVKSSKLRHSSSDIVIYFNNYIECNKYRKENGKNPFHCYHCVSIQLFCYQTLSPKIHSSEDENIYLKYNKKWIDVRVQINFKIRHIRIVKQEYIPDSTESEDVGFMENVKLCFTLIVNENINIL